MRMNASQTPEPRHAGAGAAQFGDFDPPRVADDHVAHDAEPVDEQSELP